MSTGEPLNDQADDLLHDVEEYGHLSADFTKRATAILTALAAMKYSVLAAVARPALPAPPDALRPYLRHRSGCAIDRVLSGYNLPCDCGLDVLLALPAPEPPQPPWLGGSALSPEAYAETLRAIESRAAFYHGQPGADVDWLLGIVRGIRLRGAALPAEHAPPDPTPLTTAMLTTALNDVFETTQWEGKGASIAPGLYAALKSQLACGSRPALAGSALNDEQLLAAFVAGCNAENELNEAELSPQNVRKGVAAAMRGVLHGD